MHRRALTRSRRRTSGAALLAAMLTVTIVATFAAAALWQQWRSAEVEAAERARMQSAWVLVGALDWSRLILREDGRSGGADHLAEPWAVPLEEAKLTSFLAADKNIASDALEGLPDAFLSGRITDAQSKLNARNLVDNGKPDVGTVAAFGKLFQLLGLPSQELSLLSAGMRQAIAGTDAPVPVAGATATGAGGATTTPAAAPAAADDDSASSTTAPLIPQQTAQLVWFGLSPTTVAALEPYVTVLPVRTRLNLNTASAEAIYASVASLDIATARQVVSQRTRKYFQSVADANAVVQQSTAQFDDNAHAVATNYFQVDGRLRIDTHWIEERSLLRRDGVDVKILWRQRLAGAQATRPEAAGSMRSAW